VRVRARGIHEAARNSDRKAAQHAYAKPQNRRSHGHFIDTVHQMPPYSIEAVPYRWTRPPLPVMLPGSGESNLTIPSKIGLTP